MRKEPKVNPMWFVLLVTFIAGCIVIYVETGDVSSVIFFALVVSILFGAATILLFAVAFIFAILFVGGDFLWRHYHRRASAS